MENDKLKIAVGAFVILGGIWLIIKALPMLISLTGNILYLSLMLLFIVAIAYGIFYILKKF